MGHADQLIMRSAEGKIGGIMKGCPFCADNSDIAISESEDFLAIYNQAPIVRGHSLVIPRKHFEFLMQMDNAAVSDFFLFAREATSKILSAYNATDYDWILQEGSSAGQTVPHVHLHIIPRREGDLESPGSWFERLTGTRVAVDSASRMKLNRTDMRRETVFIKGNRTPRKIFRDGYAQ